MDITGDWVLARGVRWNLKTGAMDVIDDIWARYVDTQGRVYGDQPQMAPPHPGYWVNGKAGVLPVVEGVGVAGWHAVERGVRRIGPSSSGLSLSLAGFGGEAGWAARTARAAR
ncbi:hypothetical protein AB0M46_08580 [Dactylosporangium sp. NPDC051485]|uniref:hypothetical protein n=1 Tax=Dactylosporangium sp. NPDC051485 TaxID=3154846 RepID=UPI0034302459